MSAHTPGPWKFEAATKTIRSVPTNYWLASMDSWDNAVAHEANAKLIAAAPELLEALETVYANAAESPEWIRNVLDPVIAKAKGGVL